MSSYRHPVVGRLEFSPYCAMVDLAKKGDEMWVIPQGEVPRKPEFPTLEEFMERLKKSEELRKQLGIPVMTYIAYYFPRLGYEVSHVRNIVEWARGHDMEIRVWVNEMTAHLLVTMADPDITEDAGWALHQYVQQNASSHEGMGLPSWWEFVAYGVPVPDGWELVERSEKLYAMAPGGDLVVSFG